MYTVYWVRRRVTFPYVQDLLETLRHNFSGSNWLCEAQDRIQWKNEEKIFVHEIFFLPNSLEIRTILSNNRTIFPSLFHSLFLAS